MSRTRGCASSASIASCRAAARSGSATGCDSQSRSRRLPAGVTHASSSESSVGPCSPLSVPVISRLRRVAGSSARYSPGRSTAISRTWASAVCCVVLAYATSAPAAASASGTSSVPNAARSSVPSSRASALLAAARSKCHAGSIRTRHGTSAQRRWRRILRQQQLGRLDAFERRMRLGQRRFGEDQPPRREIQPRDAAAFAVDDECREQAIAARIQQVRVGQRAGRDDARDAPLDRSLRRRRIADLLDDDHRFAAVHELGQVLVDRVIRHARHRDRRARRLAARRERDVEQARGALGVGEEQLVEIAHPVEHELVRMLGLHAQVLLHHRRVAGERGWRRAFRCVGAQGRNGGHVRIIRTGFRAPAALQTKTEPRGSVFARKALSVSGDGGAPVRQRRQRSRSVPAYPVRGRGSPAECGR